MQQRRRTVSRGSSLPSNRLRQVIDTRGHIKTKLSIGSRVVVEPPSHTSNEATLNESAKRLVNRISSAKIQEVLRREHRATPRGRDAASKSALHSLHWKVLLGVRKT